MTEKIIIKNASKIKQDIHDILIGQGISNYMFAFTEPDDGSDQIRYDGSIAWRHGMCDLIRNDVGISFEIDDE